MKFLHGLTLLSSSADSGRHCRSRSTNVSTRNTVAEKVSKDERKERKIVHRAIRKLRDEILDEADDVSPIIKLRRESRNKSDAYLIKNSQNLDDFLEVAERVEKEAARKRVEIIGKRMKD
ncbi:unnamed protein product [Gongylonema pulchrum]|uniref:DUF4145 domain-containing protein n=1 Tax=Gongylonema pulchrum TaxID=637853 RepID=A0A183DAB8_9BILA|nr:unnamed protein product [Gongylonema pulchrum]